MRLVSILALVMVGCQSTPSVSTPIVVPAGLSLEVTDMSGRSLDLAAVLEQKAVALIFWQTWCKSCRQEASALVAAAERHSGIEFVGVVPGTDSAVNDDDVRRTAAEWKLPYPQVRDRTLALTEGLGVEGTPTIIVIGKGGEILYHSHDLPGDWTSLR